MASDIGKREMAGVRAAQGAAIGIRNGGRLEDYAFAAADITTLATDIGAHSQTPVAYASSQSSQGVWKGITSKFRGANVEVKANPWFVGNAMDERDSPVTQRYLFSRGWKSAGGSLVSGAGGFGKYAGSMVNTGSTARHGSALVTTGAHMAAIKAIAESYPKAKTIADWCDAIIKAKSFKSGLRTTQTVGALVPIPLGSTIANSVAAASKLGMKVGFEAMCFLAAIEIHWRAFQEQKISNFGNPMQMVINGRPPTGAKALKVGPASRIFVEIFHRFGPTAALGRYDVDSLIKEPAGWMALGDKLLRD